MVPWTTCIPFGISTGPIWSACLPPRVMRAASQARCSTRATTSNRVDSTSSVWDQLGAPSYTLAHEIGHNMGCLHNREDSTWDSDDELSAFCFGERWYQGGQGYRTVMSYDSNPASYGNRIPALLSNPSVSYLGTSVGNAGTEDNAQVLSITTLVSNFRTSKVQAILPTVFDRVVPEGNTTSFKVRLTVQPVGSVNVFLSVSGDSDFFLSGPSSLTFDSSNWNIARTIKFRLKPTRIRQTEQQRLPFPPPNSLGNRSVE